MYRSGRRMYMGEGRGEKAREERAGKEKGWGYAYTPSDL